MGIWKNYEIVSSLGDAAAVLQKSANAATIIAGGTDLLLEIQQGHHPPVETLVDVSQIEELKQLRIKGERLFIGAAVPVNKLSSHALIKEHALAVSEATGMIGGPQVRNSATIGGNVAHALPAADGMISLVAMDAIALIYRDGEYIEVPILSLFAGPGKNTLQHNEILVGFYLKLKQDGEASAFDRVMRPQGVALPVLNHAVWLRRDGDLIKDIRIVFGPSGPVPTRALEVEKVLRNQAFTPEKLNAAKTSVRETVKFRTSKSRATAAYRYELADMLLERVLSSAWNRAEEQ